MQTRLSFLELESWVRDSVEVSLPYPFLSFPSFPSLPHFSQLMVLFQTIKNRNNFCLSFALKLFASPILFLIRSLPLFVIVFLRKRTTVCSWWFLFKISKIMTLSIYADCYEQNENRENLVGVSAVCSEERSAVKVCYCRYCCRYVFMKDLCSSFLF